MRMLALACLLAIGVCEAQTVNISVAPNPAISPASATVTWSSTGAATCTASGAWSGTKATSGSQNFTNLAAGTYNYNLACGTATADVTLSWNPPTQNTDGTPLTNLASYELFRASTAAGLPGATPVVTPAPASSYVFANVPAGPWFFSAKAVNSAGVRSDMSLSATKTVTGTSATATATLVVNSKPQPPTLVTVVAQVWELKDNGHLGALVGSIALGEECGGFSITQGNKRYNEVSLADVDLDRMPNSLIVVSRCAPPA